VNCIGVADATCVDSFLEPVWGLKTRVFLTSITVIFMIIGFRYRKLMKIT